MHADTPTNHRMPALKSAENKWAEERQSPSNGKAASPTRTELHAASVLLPIDDPATLS
jgi:hypothetical protein